MSKTQRNKLMKQIEALVNGEVPATGARVLYVQVPGRGRNRRLLTRRAKQVYMVITKHKRVTASDLQAKLKVNRNVIAGAMVELRRKRLVRAEPLNA